MKQLLLISALFISSFSFGQVLKYRTTKFAFTTLNYEKTHDSWTPTDVIVVIDLDDKRIKILCKAENRFDIISSEETKDLTGGGKLHSYYTSDQDGKSCNVSVIYTPDSDSEKWGIMVEYSNETFIYMMNLIID